ncbi:MAG: hypothetical protein AAF466_10570 [Bacteroidota bacterium]
MKRYALLFSVAVVALLVSYSFSNVEKFPDNVSAESVTMFEDHYLKTINNEDLNIQLAQNFSNLFDEVTSVDAQFSPSDGYYYIVFAEKDGKKIIDLLKVEEHDVSNETYSYIDFTNIEVNESTQYCTTGGLTCPSGCNYNPFVPCLAKCGIWNGFFCISP